MYITLSVKIATFQSLRLIKNIKKSVKERASAFQLTWISLHVYSCKQILLKSTHITILFPPIRTQCLQLYWCNAIAAKYSPLKKKKRKKVECLHIYSLWTLVCHKWFTFSLLTYFLNVTMYALDLQDAIGHKMSSVVSNSVSHWFLWILAETNEQYLISCGSALFPHN